MGTPATGTIIRDQNSYSPVMAFYDPVANNILNVTPETPLPTIQSLLALSKSSELPRPSATTLGAGTLLGTSIAITGTDAVNPIAQVSTLTPANVNINDTFTAIINGTSISYVAGAATVANVVAGLVAAINLSAQNVNVTAVNTSSTLVTITANTPGTAFTISSSVVTGIGLDTQTLVTSTPTPNVPAVAQIFTYTPLTPHVGDIFKVVINGTTIPFTCTVATVANITAGLTAAINTTGAVDALVQAVDGTTLITITSLVPGTSFTCVAATAVAQAFTVTPLHVEQGDTFTVTINGTAIPFTATAATVANVTAGLVSAINGTTGIKDLVLAADNSTYLTITSKTAGTSFTCTSYATAGTTATNQKNTITEDQANSPVVPAVAQIDYLTPADVGIGDTFTATINSHVISYVATEGTVADVCDGLAATINLNVLVKDVVTAVDHGTYISVTAKVAGTSFTCVTTTTDGGGDSGQTLTTTVQQVNVPYSAASAQIERATPAYVEIDDTFRCTINGHNVDFKATVASVNNVTTGLTNAINSDVNVNTVVTAVDHSTYLTITAQVAGTAFTCTGSTIAGTGVNNQSATAAQTIANVPAITPVQTLANTPAVAQISRETPTNVEINDSFSVTINGVTKTFVATVATVANVTAGLNALINTLTGVSSTDQGTYVAITASVAGTAFTISSSTINGTSPDTQTLTVATPTPNTLNGLGNIILAQSAAHGLTVAQLYPCTIVGVVGNTNANGSRIIKPTDTTHFQIYDTDGVTPILSNAAWISGGTVACAHYFKGVINTVGGKGILKKCIITLENDALITSGFTLFLYRSQPTTVLDGVVRPILYANKAILIGSISGIPRQQFPSGSPALQIIPEDEIEVDSTTTDIYGELVTDSEIAIEASNHVNIELVIEQRQSS